MFGTLLDKTTGFLDKRQVTTIVLPLLAFWGGVGALAVAKRWSTVWRSWAGLDVGQQVLVAGGALTGLLICGWLLEIFLPTLIRWFEGYWPGWFWSLFGGPGRWFETRRRGRLNA